MKYWTKFIDSINRLNEFVQPGVLRRYQAEILDRGELHVMSPFTGHDVVSRNNAAELPRRVAYYFPADPVFWLLVEQGAFWFGHPLSEIVIGTEGKRIRFWRMGSTGVALSADDLERLSRSAGKTRSSSDGDVRSAALILGHENFAHHFWNELPALSEWLNRCSDAALANTPVFLTSEPLGSVSKMFPRLSKAKVSLGRPSPKDFPLFVRIGGQRVPSEAREHVRGAVISNGNTAAAAERRRVLLRGHPRVWISVRHGSRTPDNQSEFLLAVLRKLFKTHPSATVAFDGFSFPAGFFDDPRTMPHRASFLERAALDRRLIDDVIDNARGDQGSIGAISMCSTSGLCLPEAISVAGACNVYLCHAGTLQHKIGWFHDVPGIVHTARSDRRYVTWCANFIEGAIVPELLPETFTITTSPPTNKRSVPRNYNYLIAEVEKAAEHVVAAFQRLMESRTVA